MRAEFSSSRAAPGAPMATLEMGVGGSGVIQRSRNARRAAWLALALALTAAQSTAQQKDKEDEEDTTSVDPTGPEGEGNLLDAPALAPLPITEAVRIRLQTLVAPEASLGSGDVTLVRS